MDTRKILCLLMSLGFPLVAEESYSKEVEKDFATKSRAYRDVPIEEISRQFFYSDKGVGTSVDSGIPNYSMGVGFRTQSGAKGFDLQGSFDNLLIILNAQIGLKASLLHYLSPSMDRKQFYIGEGVAYSHSMTIKGLRRESIGLNVVFGREIPLNWEERKFYQVSFEIPVVYRTSQVNWEIKTPLPAFQLIIGRTF